MWDWLLCPQFYMAKIAVCILFHDLARILPGETVSEIRVGKDEADRTVLIEKVWPRKGGSPGAPGDSFQALLLFGGEPLVIDGIDRQDESGDPDTKGKGGQKHCGKCIPECAGTVQPYGKKPNPCYSQDADNF